MVSASKQMNLWEGTCKLLEKDEASLLKKVNKHMQAESARLGRTIDSLYAELGEKNVIEYRQLLQAADPGTVRMIYEDWEAFIEQHPELSHLTPIREGIYKLNRMEALQASLDLQGIQTAAWEYDTIHPHLERQKDRGFEYASHVMGHTYNVGVVRQMYSETWGDGMDLLTRLTENHGKISQKLGREIASGIARGDAYRRIRKDVTGKFEHLSNSQAKKIIYTEGTYVLNESSATAFESDGWERYRLSTMEDPKVCPICRDLAGKVFDLKDRDAGINFPPLHAYCRCSYIIVTSQEDLDYVESYQ